MRESRAAYYGLSLNDLLALSSRSSKKSKVFPRNQIYSSKAGPMMPKWRSCMAYSTNGVAKKSKKSLGGWRISQINCSSKNYVPRLEIHGYMKDDPALCVSTNFMEIKSLFAAYAREQYRGHWNMWSENLKGDSKLRISVPVARGGICAPAGAATWPPTKLGFPSTRERSGFHSDK